MEAPGPRPTTILAPIEAPRETGADDHPDERENRSYGEYYSTRLCEDGAMHTGNPTF